MSGIDVGSRQSATPLTDSPHPLPPTGPEAARCAATLVESIDAAMKPTMILITRTPIVNRTIAKADTST
jgi:hypothetical protein